MKVFCKGLNPCAARRVNFTQYRDYLIQAGHEVVAEPDDAECIVIWGCGVRRDYMDNTLAIAGKYADEMGKRVILAGCVPDIDPEYVEKHFGGETLNWKNDAQKIKAIFNGSKELDEIPMLYSRPRLCANAAEYKKANPGKDACFLDESIQLYISEGCSLTCTYCSEKRMFPPYQSYPLEALVDACRGEVDLIDENEPEIPITFHADSAGDYGKDIGSSLPELLRRVCAVDPRIRVSIQGYNPAHFLEFKEEMREFLREGRLFHLRVPIQSASDRILRAMGRQYLIQDIDGILDVFKDVGFTDYSTDVLVGFPGEEEEDFRKTLRYVEQMKPRYILLSGYMEYNGLPANTLPGKVSEECKRQRLETAAAAFAALGIYCSTDGGDKADARRQTLNADTRI